MTRAPPLKREMLPVDWETTTARLAVICDSAGSRGVAGAEAGGVDGGLLGPQERASRHDHPVTADDEGPVDGGELLDRLLQAADRGCSSPLPR